MANLIDIYDVRYNYPDLKKKVISAVAKIAFYILNTEDPATTYHAERVTWAQKALIDTPQISEKFMWAVAQNATINASPSTASDNDISWVVETSVNIFAIN